MLAVDTTAEGQRLGNEAACDIGLQPLHPFERGAGLLGAAHQAEGAGKLHQYAIAHEFHHAPVMLGGLRLDQFFAKRGKRWFFPEKWLS